MTRRTHRSHRKGPLVPLDTLPSATEVEGASEQTVRTRRGEEPSRQAEERDPLYDVPVIPTVEDDLAWDDPTPEADGLGGPTPVDVEAFSVPHELIVEEVAEVEAAEVESSAPRRITSSWVVEEVAEVEAAEVESSAPRRITSSWVIEEVAEVESSAPRPITGSWIVEEAAEAVSAPPRPTSDSWVELGQSDQHMVLRWSEHARQLEEEVRCAADPREQLCLLAELGELYWMQLDDREAAQRTYERLLALDPSSELAFRALERIYYQQWQTGKLIELLVNRGEHVHSVAEQAALLRRVAEIYNHLNETDKAVIALEAALQLLPHDPEIIEQLRRIQATPEVTPARDRLEVLQFQLEQLAVGDLRRSELCQEIAELLARRGKGPEAAAAWEQVLKLDPRRQACYRKLERYYRDSRQPEQLANVLRRHLAVAHGEERLRLLEQLARLYEGPLQNPLQAKQVYLEMLTLQPDYAPAREALLAMAEQLGDWAAVQTALSELVEREQSPAARARLLHRLGTLQRQHSSDAVAERSFLQALEFAPHQLSSISELVEIYQLRGDWGKAVKLLLQAESLTSNPIEKVQLLYQAGMARLDQLDDTEGAVALLRRVLELDPDHVEAARPLSELYWRRTNHAENEPLLTLLLRKGGADVEYRRQTLYRLGVTTRALGEAERAIRSLKQALELEPRDLAAWRELAEAAWQREQWDLFRQAGDHIIEQRAQLNSADLVTLLERMARCCLALEQRDRALLMLEQLLQIDPNHRYALERVSELRAANEDWAGVVKAKRASLEQVEEPERLALLREIGEIEWHKLGRHAQAAEALRRALALQPDHHGIIHDLIDIYSEAGQWQQTAEMCERMAELETQPEVRAKYHLTIAAVYRDRLGDAERAIQHFNRALDGDYSQLKAFEAIDALCTRERAWKQLEKNYARMIQRLPEEGHRELKIMLWHNLGELLRSRRRDMERAIAAFEVAAQLDPGNLERRRILGELYLGAGAQYADQAISTYHELLRREPHDTSLYRTLHQVFMRVGRYERAWCLSGVLGVLRQATNEEQHFFQQYRTKRARRANACLTEELWRRQVCHPDQNPYIGAILGLVTPVIASMTARPPSHYRLKPKERRAPGESDLAFGKLFDYVTAVLNVAPADLYVRPDRPEGLVMAHTAERPSFAVGAHLLHDADERVVAFNVARQLTYLRPEHFLRNALPTRAQLQAVLLAAIKSIDPRLPLTEAQEQAASPLIERLQRYLQPAQREQLVRVIRRIKDQDATALSIDRWWNALDLTSDRVGFILCDDLGVAASMINAGGAISEVSPEERVFQLVQYAASETYLDLREKLGFRIGR